MKKSSICDQFGRPYERCAAPNVPANFGEISDFSALTPFAIIPQYSGMATAYKNKEYIADIVCPRRQVLTASFVYRTFAQGQFFTVPKTLVNRTGTPNTVEFGSTNTTSTVNGYGLKDIVPMTDIRNAEQVQGYDPLAIATMGITDLVLLDREIRVAANIVFASGSYDPANRTTLTGLNQWSDPSCNPLLAFEAGRKTMLQQPTHFVLGYDTFAALRTNPSVVNAVRKMYAQDGRVTAADLSALFECEVIVGSAFYNTAAEGQTAVLARAWGKHAALISVNLNSTPMGQPTFCFTAQWGPRIARTKFDDEIGLEGANVVTVGEYVKELAIASKAGYLWTSAVA